MPIWLRHFTFNKLRTHYEERNKQSQTKKDPKKVTLVDQQGNVNKEAFKQASPTLKTPQYK